jgi:hypothetical protein
MRSEGILPGLQQSFFPFHWCNTEGAWLVTLIQIFSDLHNVAENSSTTIVQQRHADG